MKKIKHKKNKVMYNLKNVERKLFLVRLLISKKEKNIFIENFSLLYGSGMGISKILSILKKENKTWAMKYAIKYISKHINNGESLWKTFKKTNILSAYFISLVKMGEESGTMAENLNLILEQQRKEHIYNSKIRSAMLYPGFVISLTLIIGLGTAFFVLPRLTGIFTSLGVELPLATRILIAFSNFITEKGAIFFPVFITIILLLFFFLFIFKKTNFIGFWILFKTPGISKLIQYVELARMGYFLGTLLEASVPILKSLNSLSEASKFKLYSDFYKRLHDDVKNGLSIEQSLKKYKYSKKLIPSSVQALIVAGEQSGKLGSSLMQIGKKFDAKIETTTKNLSVMLEPILLVIVWMGVLLVALAVILPIYNLVGGIGNQNEKQSQNINTPSSQEQIEVTTEDLVNTPEIIIQEKIVIPQKPDNLLEILPTGTGFLNVRSTPSLNGSLVGKVEPTDTYIYTEIDNGWYQITLDSGEIGWILGSYVSVLE